MKELTRKQIEESLPDYISGELNDAEKLTFEQSISNYPDMMEELNEVEMFLNKIDKSDFDLVLINKTRNMAVKVNNRLEKNNSSSVRFNIFNRNVLSIAAVFLIVVASLFIFKSGTNEIDVQIQDQYTSKMNFDEISVILSEAIDDEIEDVSTITQVNSVNFPDVYSNRIEEMYYEEMYKYIDEITNYLGSNFSYNNNLYGHFESIDEAEFQIILKELENVGKFN